MRNVPLANGISSKFGLGVGPPPGTVVWGIVMHMVYRCLIICQLCTLVLEDPVYTRGKLSGFLCLSDLGIHEVFALHSCT